MPHDHALHAPETASPRGPVDPADFAHIPGWGVDRDRADRPAVPMERMPPRLDVATRMPPQQPQTVEILHSTERPGITPVFGTTVPPSGVSGGLRRIAFKFSENDVRRWMLLLVADRVHMVEGLVADVGHGHVPNLYAEMGGRAELRHNPAGAARKAATLALVAGVAWWWWRGRSRD
jgi:hypothetical protein